MIPFSGLAAMCFHRVQPKIKNTYFSSTLLFIHVDCSAVSYNVFRDVGLLLNMMEQDGNQSPQNYTFNNSTHEPFTQDVHQTLLWVVQRAIHHNVEQADISTADTSQTGRQNNLINK